jgi:hypothetical protein
MMCETLLSLTNSSCLIHFQALTAEVQVEQGEVLQLLQQQRNSEPWPWTKSRHFLSCWRNYDFLANFRYNYVQVNMVLKTPFNYGAPYDTRWAAWPCSCFNLRSMHETGATEKKRKLNCGK